MDSRFSSSTYDKKQDKMFCRVFPASLFKSKVSPSSH